MCVLKVMGPKSTTACKYNQLCSGLKANIDGIVQGVQATWDTNSSMYEWFSLVKKTILTRSIALECFELFAIYGHSEIFLFLTVIVTDH